MNYFTIIIYDTARINNPGKRKPYQLYQEDIVKRSIVKMDKIGDKLIVKIVHKGDTLLIFKKVEQCG